MPWDELKVYATIGYGDYVSEIQTGKMTGNLSINLINPSADELFTLEKETEIMKNIFKDTKVKDLKFVSEKDVMMLGEKAREIVMTFLNPNDETITEKVVATVTVKNNKSYRAILEEEEAEFNDNLPYYEKVRNSLRPLGSSAPVEESKK